MPAGRSARFSQPWSGLSARPCRSAPRSPSSVLSPPASWAGLDLKPVDLSNPPEVAWLEALVWPEQTDRLARLRAAIKIAVEQKPRLVKGDLRTDLAALVQEAPKNATLVIFHTVVLAYISAATEREEFAQSVGLLSDFWIANEPPRVFPNIAGRAGREGPKDSFLLSVNGVPVAWTDPHGASVDWIGAPSCVPAGALLTTCGLRCSAPPHPRRSR